ncbi:MAG TPA: phosphotransferase [Candidatus Acidoferrales bacterium]|nr:phosphotransferase [Candidatus Acidoferrales bacterium]
MIPQEKSAAVTRGLREAFGVTECEEIRMIKDLASSLVYRIVVRGSAFLLKISMRTSDPARHYSCMRAAAEAGLAPRVRYTSVEDRVSIEDFVETKPFPAAEAMVRVPAALRRLHALPPFAGVPHAINTSCMFLIHNGAARDGFFQKFRAANILGEGECEELFALHSRLAAAYPRHDPDMVSSHNDLFKPDNILFDGQRVWLVDWEAAFLNDRYADLAVVANLLVSNEAEDRAYLREYFGEPPDPYQAARFFLMRQVAHMFYAMGFLFLSSAARPIDWSETVPEYRDFHRRIWAGEVNLTDQRIKALFGRVHREQLLQNVRQARYEEALRIVSYRHSRIVRR